MSDNQGLYNKKNTFLPFVRIASIGLLLLIAVAAQWQGPQAVASSDGIAYITTGLNLLSTGSYTNPHGDPEIWYPPLYPLLIGIFSVGGRIDALIVARMISIACALFTMFLIWWICRRQQFLPRLTPFFSAVALVCNALWQLRSNVPMSESLATLLSVSAFAIWLTLPGSKTSSTKYISFALLGAVIALSYLTRPEGIILLPFFAAIDIYRKKQLNTFFAYCLAGFVLFLVISPYLMFLYNHTGKLSLSGKTQVNIAQGRFGYYEDSGTFGKYIDPNTLELKYYNHDITLRSEARRYAYNLGRIAKQYFNIFHGLLGIGLLLMTLVGLSTLVLLENRRFIAGLLALLAYLLVAACFSISARFLHATLPVLSIFIGCGIARTLKVFFSPSFNRTLRIGVGILLLWAALGLIEGYTRYPRWVLQGWGQEKTLLREAGLKFASLELPKGMVFSRGDTIAYYAGQYSKRMTQDNLSTIIRYIDKNQKGPVYLALTNLHQLHPSMQELLSSGSTIFEELLTLHDSRGRVVIYRIK